jgi:hypothetical protein
MQKLARGLMGAAWLVAGAAALVACSSTSTNEASGGASSTGGASGASGASSGGTASGGDAGASTGGTGGAPSAVVWCSAPKDCVGLCSTKELQSYCTPAGLCTCIAATCEPGTLSECPAGMTCNFDNCYPDGTLAAGDVCVWPTKRCASGLICHAPNPTGDAGWDFRCRRPCKLAAAPAGCTCQKEGAEPVWGWCT